MSDKTDEVSGRAKEAAGAVTGNADLKREGKVEQGAADAKKKVTDAIDVVKEKVEDLVNRD
ncbi:MAG: CsbD family protein [Acidimicrobiia bacterium]|nr:CsbD family protein [Acidimicrobiia bacterium]